MSWVSPCYGGKTTDIKIVPDFGFLDILEPYDTVKPDRAFKIKSDLTFRRCFLSAAKGNQVTSNDITETGKVANVRTFVKKTIARIKWFRNFKTRVPLL